MKLPHFHRRTLFGAAIATPLLAACQSGSTSPPVADPSMSPAPSTSPAPLECIELGNHRFQPRALCREAGTTSDDEEELAEYTHFGPIHATEDTVVAWYVDAIVEWDAHTGEPLRLLAPKRADNWYYAVSGEFTVNSRCDGTLMVHVDGCLVDELPGHEAPADGGDAILSLVEAGPGRVVSLGQDGTLRLWNLDDAEQVALHELYGDAAGYRIHVDGGRGELLLTALEGSTVQILAADTLEVVDEITDLPAVATGWLPTPNDAFVGIATGATEDQLVLLDRATSEITALEGKPFPRLVTVADDGTLAVAHHSEVALYRAGEATPTYFGWRQREALSFSPDGTQLHTLMAGSAMTTFDVATGEQVIKLSDPPQPE